MFSTKSKLVFCNGLYLGSPSKTMSSEGSVTIIILGAGPVYSPFVSSASFFSGAAFLDIVSIFEGTCFADS